VLTGKGNGGDVGALLRSRVTEGEDMRWSSNVSAVREQGSGVALGPRVQAWANRGREGVGASLRATVSILI
jgi:hypothetical protein